MIGLIQRVTQAEVREDGISLGAIAHGLVALIGVERGDGKEQAERLLERLLNYRVFDDAAGRMGQDLREVDGALLLVPQFTLVADTRKGTRPSFTPAAPPEEGRLLFQHLLRYSLQRHPRTAAGNFGAKMRLELINDGPVTFWLQARPPKPRPKTPGKNRLKG